MPRLSHGLAAIVLCLILVQSLVAVPTKGTERLRVGVLHSLTGTMAISEVPVRDATLLAISEINEKGGLLGRPVEVVVADGKSDWPTFAAEAERLIVEEHVVAVFGCWTSASRKTVKPVFEKHNSILFYPVQYEGVEQSPNIVYLGATPNQQIIPSVTWAFQQKGMRRFFLVGSDYVFPRTANAILKDYLKALGGEVVGEEYLLLGSQDVDAAVARIVETKPDVILNTINGDSNVAFFRELRAAGVRPENIPTISYSIAEPELQSMNVPDMVGDYAAWNYFMSLESRESAQFVAKYRARFGQDKVVSDPLEAAYSAVHLWARAVEETGSARPQEVLASIRDLGFEAPGGMVYIDHDTLHTWKTVYIGEIRPDAQFNIVWNSGLPVRPVPFPRTRTREQWDQSLQSLFDKWNGRWAASAPEVNP